MINNNVPNQKIKHQFCWLPLVLAAVILYIATKLIWIKIEITNHKISPILLYVDGKTWSPILICFVFIYISLIVLMMVIKNKLVISLALMIIAILTLLPISYLLIYGVPVEYLYQILKISNNYKLISLQINKLPLVFVSMSSALAFGVVFYNIKSYKEISDTKFSQLNSLSKILSFNSQSDLSMEKMTSKEIWSEIDAGKDPTNV